MSTTQAPTTVDASRSMFDEPLGTAPGRARLVGRKVIVVGAGQRKSPPGESIPAGNGRATSLLFAREGAAVACIDVAADAAANTVSDIESAGGRAFAEVADVRDSAAIAPLVARCAEKLGGLDGLVLNVGISKALSLPKLTAEAWDDDFAVNLRSHMLFAQAALPLMAPGGSIVLISSVAALRNAARNPAYEASKAAQVSLSRAIAFEGEGKAIRCNAVLPGLIDTPMGRDATRRRPARGAEAPFGRQGTGWEIAYACLFLMSHESSYVNGHALVVDGGIVHGIVRASQ